MNRKLLNNIVTEVLNTILQNFKDDEITDDTYFEEEKEFENENEFFV